MLHISRGYLNKSRKDVSSKRVLRSCRCPRRRTPFVYIVIQPSGCLLQLFLIPVESSFREHISIEAGEKKLKCGVRHSDMFACSPAFDGWA